ncbi:MULTISPECIES: translocation/assembly module TamB domain-containing protein [unclassified Shinella]|uniref:translocation/assembly module TamB domain-containing protein n=1 Tax=unclassified Shinella TaxID=2643062 RepID=UPI00234EF50F|nr:MULTISPECIES: translocation/assembly module TamB domain-containing protein [unclassified Shinella]MCO5152422.1 translocation/assembly module TamB [Shinella sp.]MDC7263817.1 translocation/assembly module TamB [Shinella sp. HY16]MDC7270713.1 translocation/assembly module TamB [Shinella sp. YZ44]
MNRLSRILRATLRFIGYGLAVLVVLLAGLVGFIGFTDAGARFAVSQAEKIAAASGQVISISEPSGLLTGKLRAGSIALGDARGTYAEIRDLAVDWSPLQLLFFSFEAERVSTSSVSLLRLPEPKADAEPSDTPFTLPVEVHVGALDVPELFVSGTVAGRDQRIVVSGSGDATAESVAVKLSASEKARPDARVAADIVFNPADNELRLEADVAEPKGGLLAALLKLPNDPAVTIRLTGDGPLSEWTGRLSAALDGAEMLRVDGRHDLATNGLHTIALSGGGTFDALMPPQLRPLFAGETGIDVVAAFDGSDMLRIEKGSISTGAMTLAASGTVSAKGANDLDVKFSGKDGPVDFRWPLAEGDARVLIEGADLSLTGEATAAALEANATVVSAELPAGRVENIRLTAKSEAFNVASQSGRIDAVLETGMTAFASADVDRTVKGPAKLVATLTVSPDEIAFDPATLESASIGGTLSGRYGLKSREADVNFRLFALPAVLPPALAGKFDTTIAMEGRVQLAGDGAVQVSGLQVKSGTLETAGTISLGNGALDAALTGKVLNLGKLLADAAGEAAFELSATGPVAGLDVSAKVTSSGATLSGRTLSDLVVTLTGKAVADSPSGELTATGALDGQPINVRSSITSEGGRIAVPVLEAEIGPNTLKGSLALADNFMPDGTIRFDFPDLGLLAAMAGQKAAGDLSGQVEIATGNGRTSATIQASGSAIRRDDLSITKPAVDLTIADLATAAITGTVRAERVASGENRLEALKLGFSREGQATNFDLTGRLDGAPLLTKGKVIQRDGGLDVALQAFEAAPRRIALKLAKPTTIGVTNGVASLDGLTIQAGRGSIAVTGRAGEALDLSVRLSALPAALVNNFADGLGAEGTIGGMVTVKGRAAAPVVNYALDWGGAVTSQTRGAGIGALTITAKGEFANNQVRLDTVLSGGGGLSFRGGGTVGIGGATPLGLKFNGTVPFGLLQGQLSAQGFVLTGNANVDLSIGGTAAAPSITGSITAGGARLVDVRRNLAVENLTVRVTMDGRQAVIETVSGKLASGGQLSASGRVGIDPASGFPVDVAVKLGDITYVDGTLVTANVAGDLTLKGPVAGLSLGGKVRINKANITIPQKLPASLSEIDIKHRNAPADVKRMTADVQRDQGSSGASRGIALDLTIEAPGQLFVRGRGINAELGGSLKITGTSASPVVSGGFELERGRMEILTRRLDFTSAHIGFAGGLVPTVNLVAGSTAGSTEITVTVAGLANNPTVTFASSPSLPQDEILAQLIFNRSMSNLSAVQIAQLASAASQLAGGSSTGLLDSLRSKLGVDDLDITTDAEGRAAVSAGKYLNERTYIELKQDPETNGAKAVINLDVGRGLKLRGEAGSGGSAGAGIFYEKEY